jgi:quercetin dioxygenase-like cupin family protein
MEVRIEFSRGRSLAACVLAVAVAGSASAQQSTSPTGRVPPTLLSAPLAEAPGHNLVVVELDFAPNAAPPSTAERHARGHHHPGSVYVYVTQGAVRLGLEGEPVRVVREGESFFEPLGAHHIITENASATEPAHAIAVMIVPDGKPLTTRDEE